MSKPLIVSIPHRLGKDEALRRIKSGLGNVRTNYSQLLRIDEETWAGDRLSFKVSAVGQHASGNIEVRESEVQLEVTLPWLLHKLAERIAPDDPQGRRADAGEEVGKVRRRPTISATSAFEYLFTMIANITRVWICFGSFRNS